MPKSFTEDIVREMAKHAERPVILPLSNPTRLHEAVPEDLLKWTDGRALVATGSPFDPVKGPWGKDGAEIEIEVAECNNSVVFPGIGLGAVLARASKVTDKMLVAAVRGVAGLSPALKDDTAPLLPGVEHGTFFKSSPFHVSGMTFGSLLPRHACIHQASQSVT